MTNITMENHHRNFVSFPMNSMVDLQPSQPAFPDTPGPPSPSIFSHLCSSTSPSDLSASARVQASIFNIFDPEKKKTVILKMVNQWKTRKITIVSIEMLKKTTISWFQWKTICYWEQRISTIGLHWENGRYMKKMSTIGEQACENVAVGALKKTNRSCSGWNLHGCIPILHPKVLFQSPDLGEITSKWLYRYPSPHIPIEKGLLPTQTREPTRKIKINERIKMTNMFPNHSYNWLEQPCELVYKPRTP